MDDLMIEREATPGSKVKISLNGTTFQFVKSFFTIQKQMIRIDYDRFHLVPGSHINFYNKHQMVSVIFTEDLELDFFRVSEENGISINFSSNTLCAEVFSLMENWLKATDP